MDILPVLCIVSAAFTGLTKGAGVLPNDTLDKAVGETVMFTTTVTPGKQITTANWKFGDKNIITYSGINNTAPDYEGRITLFLSTGSLELRNLSLQDSGEYKVTIIPFGEQQVDGTTRLGVYVPVSNVTATVRSTDLVEFNSSVRLSCSSSGSSLSFLWLNGSSEVTASDRVQLSDGNSTLTTVNVTRYDQGPFTCRVSNPISSGTSGSINFNISYGPENVTLIMSTSKDHYPEGSNIILTCSAESRPHAQFMWLLNGVVQSDTGPELRLMDIQMTQSGSYSCQAFNSKTLRYVTSQPAAISVLKRISGASITSSTNLTFEGNSLNLTCDAAGSVFTRKWTKGGSDLIPAVNTTLHDNNRVLYFSSLSKTDGGVYSCDVSNPLGNDEANFKVVVYYGPDNVRIRGPTEIHLKETFTLTCYAESVPASYSWIFNGKEIHSSAVYTKNNIETSDGGNYTCHVMNDLTGRSSSAVHRLTVTDKPSPCMAGCIAGIVIAVFVILFGAVGAAYYIYNKKKQTKKFLNRNATSTGGEGQDNTAYSGSQDLNYADISVFKKKDGGTVQLELENNASEYSEVRVNNSPPASSSPPTYDDHLQRMARTAQPDADAAQVYAQVRKK